MRELIRWLLGVILKPTGRHRAVSPEAPTRPCPSLPPLPRWYAQMPIDGHAVPIVRPYVIAYERRVEVYRQRERRRALVLATMGIDYAGVGR
jgi:hypothetical protein